MSRGRSELDSTKQLLDQVGFEFVPAVIPELVERAVREELPLADFLDLVLVTERDSREQRRVKTALRLSGLPVGKSLDDFDFLFQRGVDKARIEMLATCEFARRRENVLLLGPPGVGKTHLAAGLGMKAVQCGFSVTYLSADELVAQLRKDDEAGVASTHVVYDLIAVAVEAVGSAGDAQRLPRPVGSRAFHRAADSTAWAGGG